MDHKCLITTKVHILENFDIFKKLSLYHLVPGNKFWSWICYHLSAFYLAPIETFFIIYKSYKKKQVILNLNIEKSARKILNI